MFNLKISFLFTVLTMTVLASTAGAQEPDRAPASPDAPLQFNFSSPGARSLGLGGAFIGLADDATASYTNPAGLLSLSKPEISFEGRHLSYSTRYANAGRGFGEPSGNPTDIFDTVKYANAETDVTSLSFLSYVYPRDRWALAFYRHTLADFLTSYDSQGSFFSVPAPTLAPLFPEGFVDFRVLPVSVDLDMEVINYGISFAYRVSEKFSIGLGASHYELSLYRKKEIYGTPDFYDHIDFADSNVALSTTQDRGDDSDVGINIGFLWKPSSRWSLGGVYRQGAEFESLTRMTSSSEGDSTSELDPLNTPDVWGVGLAFRPTDLVTLTLDYNRVEYSAIWSNASIGPFEGLDANLFRIEDVSELHLGFEYVVKNLKSPLAIRLGLWREPDHNLTFIGSTDPIDPPSADIFESIEELVDTAGRRGASIVFPSGDDEMHYSFGLGMVFADRFQLDIAFDFSEVVDTASLSGVIRF